MFLSYRILPVMRIVPLGETAWILAELEASPWWVADRLREAAVPGLADAAAAYETVGVYFEFPPGQVQRDQIESAVALLEGRQPPLMPLVEVPVCYELGEDVEEISSRLGLTVAGLAQAHSKVEYECFAVGFQPGFPYLGYLPDSLSGIPRLASPRTRVAAGSVGITGRQTGIYPGGSPGGWPLIGRTPMLIADLDHGKFLFRSGLRVRFMPMGKAEYDSFDPGEHPGTIEECPP